MVLAIPPVNRSRRALLHAGSPRAAVRPPGAIDEARFLDRCTRCNDCIAVCPEHILVRADGGFPERDWQRGECTFCGDCVAACQSKALEPIAQQAWPWRALIGAHCLASRGVTCQSCREICPSNAIAFRPGVAWPVMNTAQCNGCGACVGVCPVAAIVMQPMATVPIAAHD